MKKIVTIAMAGALALSLVACGGSSASSAAPAASAPAASTASTAASVFAFFDAAVIAEPQNSNIQPASNIAPKNPFSLIVLISVSPFFIVFGLSG